MSKDHRGVPLKSETPGSGRGACPVCKRTGIKLLYQFEVSEVKRNLCKQCYSAVNKGKFKEALAAL